MHLRLEQTFMGEGKRSIASSPCSGNARADTDAAMLSQKEIPWPGGSCKTFKFVQALGVRLGP